jgi:acetyltransferase
MADLVNRSDKPVAFYISTTAQEVNAIKQSYDFPIFTQVVETIRALEMSYHHCVECQDVQAESSPPESEIDVAAIRELTGRAQREQRDLLLSEAVEVLEHAGIPTARSVVAQTMEEAQEAAEAMGYPVAIKVISDQISHKSDVGGVQLNLRNGPAVAAAFEDMLTRIHHAYPEVRLDGVLVQPMVTGGRELILGGRQDPQFGPVVLVGLGGIFVEIFQEVTVRVAPISRREALEMIEELRGSQVLQGARGHKRSDIEAVVDALLRLSQLLGEVPEIQEIDVNPLRVFHEQGGCRALDARIIL